jgi:membrane associated rhomboid family serine protease
MTLHAILRKLTTIHLLMISVALVSLLAFASKRIKRALILSPTRVRRGEVYRLLTAGWLHGDLMHLLMNMYVLSLFADRVLAVFGEALFLALYVSAVVMAYVPTTIRFRNEPKYSSLGASGAVAAVMLSAVLLDPTISLRFMFFPVRVPGVVFAILYMLYSVWHSAGSDDNINHDAHFSGALYGALATIVWAPDSVLRTIRVMRRFLDG